MEAELKKLEDDRKKQVQEMERFEAERKRMEEHKEKHKAELAKLELERKKEEETRLCRMGMIAYRGSHQVSMQHPDQ